MTIIHFLLSSVTTLPWLILSTLILLIYELELFRALFCTLITDSPRFWSGFDFLVVLTVTGEPIKACSAT